MGTPTHGPWCKSVTYPITCHHCGQRIFYFSCNHGSKVFFNSLGWPWAIHNCRSPKNIIKTVDFHIEEDYIRLIQENAKKRRQREEQPHIQSYKPHEAEIVKDLGIVRDVVRSINVYKKFNVPADGPWAAAMLGNLTKDKYAQVTVHSGDLGQQLHSYTFLVKRKDWDKVGSIRGDLMEFTLEGLMLATGDGYWLCTEIENL